MNLALSGGEVGGISSAPGEDWTRVFGGGGTMETSRCAAAAAAAAADAAATRCCGSLTTISVADLDQFDSYPGCRGAASESTAAESVDEPGAADGQPSQVSSADWTPAATSADPHQRLSGLPLKHRYKQTTRNQSCRRH